MSVHSGRMSHREAYNTLTQIHSTATGLQRPDLVQRADTLQALTDASDYGPDARAIRALNDEVAELVWNRLQNSELLPPSVSPMCEVVLYGTTTHQDTRSAAVLAAQHLRVSPDDVRLVDATPYERPTAVGTRYSFRVEHAQSPAVAL